MAKQDVLDAINATIVENNQKGITAQALNNVLTLMTENAGEGSSGEGALRLLVPDTITLQMLLGNTTDFSVSGVTSILEESGADASVISLFTSLFEHNATVYNALSQNADINTGVPVFLDPSQTLSMVYTSFMETETKVSALIPAVAMAMFAPAAEQEDINFIGYDADGLLGYKINSLNSAGELTLEYIVEEAPVLYVYATLSDEQKASNKAIYDNRNTAGSWEKVTIVSELDKNRKIRPIAFDASTCTFTYFVGGILFTATLASDGTPTQTTIGTVS